MATTRLRRATAAAALLLTATSPATAAPRGKIQPHGLPFSTPAGQLGVECHPGRNTLTYHGGDLVEHPAPFVIFWGPEWQTDATHQAVAGRVRAILQQLAGSGYGCSWREYALPGSPMDAGSYLGDEIVATPPVQHAGDELTDAAIQARILTEVDASRAPAPTDDVIYVVVPPAGVPVRAFGLTGCGGSSFFFCAYHDSFRRLADDPDRFRYVVLPFPCTQDGFTCFFDPDDSSDPATRAGRSLEALASHEVAETVTDPDAPPVGAGGWYDDRTGEENADICASFGCEAEIAAGGDTFLVNSLWSNLAGGCVFDAACTPPVPQCTDFAPGVCSPGARSPRGCSLEWLVHPNLSLGREGLPDTKVACADGQPFCDVDGAPDGRCTFRVAVCLNNTDPRQRCTTSPITGVTLGRRLSRITDPADLANATTLLAALAGVNGPGGETTSDTGIAFTPALGTADACTDYFDVVVPASARSHRPRALKVAVRTTGGTVRAKLNLVCTPTFP
ncbi:MAG TPA: hypothetical protein VFD84_16115 [Candidatus Binatia bacterium]|nr:hypothetical protein [Candidatus Binatia bacterium]